MLSGFDRLTVLHLTFDIRFHMCNCK